MEKGLSVGQKILTKKLGIKIGIEFLRRKRKSVFNIVSQ
jgi:hypothetical protein